MNNSSIALINTKTGEVGDIFGKLPDNKFTVKGYKMYNLGVINLIDIFTREEMKRTILLFDSKHVDYHNLLMPSFLDLTRDMSKAARSRFRTKLIDNMVMQEYNKRLMLNPYIFIPRGDANIHNSRYLTQRVWKWLFTDKDAATDAIIQHAEHMFGKVPGNSTQIIVGSGEYAKLIDKPEPCK